MLIKKKNDESFSTEFYANASLTSTDFGHENNILMYLGEYLGKL